MSESKPSLSIDQISPEARRAAAEAAEAAGMPLEDWLSQLIKYVSAMEQRDREGTVPNTPEGQGVPDAAADAEAAVEPETAPPETSPGSAPGTAPKPAPRAAVGPAPHPRPEPAPAAVRTAASDQWSVGTAPIDNVHMSRFAADQAVEEAEIEAALDALRRNGALEPIVVRRHPVKPGSFEIVSGAERWEAARRAELAEVPVVIKELSDQDALKAVLVQRLRRRTASPLEVANVCRRLMREAAATHEELAKALGRSPAHVENLVLLLDLPEGVQDLVDKGEITLLHARALADAVDPEAAAREVVARRLDIYQTEQLVRSSREGPGARRAPTTTGDAVATIQIVERQLSALLGLKVSITERNEIGVLSIHYTNRDQLNALVERLNSAGGG